jgi:spermidine/putrescine transport system permease protein
MNAERQYDAKTSLPATGFSKSWSPWLKSFFRQTGFLVALPAMALLAAGFIVPMLITLFFSVMPARTFNISASFTLENYINLFTDTYYLSFGWSLLLALLSTLILMLISWPIAYGLARSFRRSMFITLLLVLPLFVSENVRMFGWVLSLIKNGVLDGALSYFFNSGVSDLLYNVPVTLFGMVYVYLPFMLFPMTLGISMIPEPCREAAFDMGASRWQLFREVELPLAMPGIMIGALLTFVLVLGSVTEAKILGGQAVIMAAHEIETAFTSQQNWPLGASLATLLTLISGGLALTLLSKINLDKIFGHKH